jgi:hypothetical protein
MYSTIRPLTAERWELELVRREEDRHAPPRLFAQHVGQQVGRDRVKPGKRLVADQEVGTVHQRRGELNALLVALRKLLDTRDHTVAEPETVPPRARGSPRLLMRRAVQDGEILELVGNPHLGIQAALLGHVADSLAHPSRRSAHLATSLCRHRPPGARR